MDYSEIKLGKYYRDLMTNQSGFAMTVEQNVGGEPIVLLTKYCAKQSERPSVFQAPAATLVAENCSSGMTFTTMHIRTTKVVLNADYLNPRTGFSGRAYGLIARFQQPVSVLLVDQEGRSEYHSSDILVRQEEPFQVPPKDADTKEGGGITEETQNGEDGAIVKPAGGKRKKP